MRNACLINFTNLWRRNEMKRWRNIPKFRQDSHHSAKSKDGRNLRALEHICIGPIHWHPLLALFARRKLGSISGCRSPIGNTLILRNSKFSLSIWFPVGNSLQNRQLCVDEEILQLMVLLTAFLAFSKCFPTSPSDSLNSDLIPPPGLIHWWYC